MSAWSTSIAGRPEGGLAEGEPARVGVVPGEGIGPEVTAAAALVLKAVSGAHGHRLELSYGPAADTAASSGSGLPAEADRFCRDTFAAGGAILAGPHGGRWVYELRRRFDLFCKISPLRPSREIGDIAGPIRPREVADVDLLIVREQSAGVYQGRWREASTGRGDDVAEHAFSYSRGEVMRIVEPAAKLAARRSARLAIVVKDGGVPSISKLWRSCAESVATRLGVRLETLDVDFAAYRLIRDPLSLDVVVAPNLFGDVLSDVGGALLGSRGLGYGGNFDAGAAAVYQTNHGAAHDLAGSDRANPVGQILSAAMMLRESFGLAEEARLIEEAVGAAWRQGWRTRDLAEPGCRVVGTREMAERVVDAIGTLGGARPTEPRTRAQAV